MPTWIDNTSTQANYINTNFIINNANLLNQSTTTSNKSFGTKEYREKGYGVFYFEMTKTSASGYALLGFTQDNTTFSFNSTGSANFEGAIRLDLMVGNNAGVLLDLSGTSIIRYRYTTDGVVWTDWQTISKILSKVSIGVVLVNSGTSANIKINTGNKPFLYDFYSMVGRNDNVFSFDGSKQYILAYEKMLLQSNNKMYSLISAPQYNLAKDVLRVTASGGSYPEKTIDENTGNVMSYGWYSSSMPSAWIKYEFKDKTTIDTIDIFSYYHSGYEAIKNFIIEASDTGQFTGEQKVLYTGIHPNDTTTNFVTYSFHNFSSFKFYRINISEIYYGNGGNNLSINEVQFWCKNIILMEIPNTSPKNFIKYGVSPEINTNTLTANRAFVLQNRVSSGGQEFLAKSLDKKPKSIMFN
ncbi:hypothetical protein EYB33_07795 [Lysinibacillus sphaericus]|uniref:hypothetical protein n=1 Tax=Lysinibacillus sphaericus TaxID=1421 RepID=UPI001E5F5D24|nr:hypothetical protein [Lysinibacillus sphaericus]UDK96203.1 hypothetical protein EYB33_07795 [Lysinibacillus sphaericus]